MVHGVLQSEDTQKHEATRVEPNVLPYPRATSARVRATAPCEVLAGCRGSRIGEPALDARLTISAQWILCFFAAGVDNFAVPLLRSEETARDILRDAARTPAPVAEKFRLC